MRLVQYRLRWREMDALQTALRVKTLDQLAELEEKVDRWVGELNLCVCVWGLLVITGLGYWTDLQPKLAW